MTAVPIHWLAAYFGLAGHAVQKHNFCYFYCLLALSVYCLDPVLSNRLWPLQGLSLAHLHFVLKPLTSKGKLENDTSKAV